MTRSYHTERPTFLAVSAFKPFSPLSAGFLAQSCCSSPNGARGEPTVSGSSGVPEWTLHGPSPEHKPAWARAHSGGSWLSLGAEDR